jgi:hypothetical protein
MMTRKPAAAMLGMAELYPVHIGVGKQPEQDHRPPFAQLVIGQLDAVG